MGMKPRPFVRGRWSAFCSFFSASRAFCGGVLPMVGRPFDDFSVKPFCRSLHIETSGQSESSKEARPSELPLASHCGKDWMHRTNMACCIALR
jgi:hypothetical protein